MLIPGNNQALSRFVISVVFIAASLGVVSETRADEGAAAVPLTTSSVDIPLDELALRLQPLTKDELVVEADAWLGLLKAKVTEIAEHEIEVKRKNREMKEVAAGAKEATRQIEAQAEKLKEQGTAADTPEAAEEAITAAQAEAKETADAAISEKAAAKEYTLGKLTELHGQRTALVDRVNVVLTALEDKGGDASEYRTYVTAVSGINVDVTDVSATWQVVTGWITSPQGGMRWAKNIVLFIVTLIVFRIIAAIAARMVAAALRVAKNVPNLLQAFFVGLTRNVVFLIGVVVALSMLEIPMGPFVAAIGAVGFVVAFALQGTLSNFAAGLMILLYRPYDIGDVVNVAGVIGTVQSMSMVSTKIATPDNQSIIVPNGSIWGGIITNITGSQTRRVDMTFGIGYGDDIVKAKSVLEGILKDHPLVLDDPEPVVQLHELADSSVNFVCRPWSKTGDYWTVYWDVTRSVKERFDAEGISIPYPQQDVHMHQVAPPA